MLNLQLTWRAVAINIATTPLLPNFWTHMEFCRLDDVALHVGSGMQGCTCKLTLRAKPMHWTQPMDWSCATHLA